MRRRGPALAIRTRIALGSLVIALLLAVPAGFVLDAQIRAIVRLGTAEVLRSDQAPYLTEISTGRDDGFDPPRSGQLLAVVGPGGSTPVDTLPRAVRTRIAVLIEEDETRAVRAGGRTYIVRVTPVRDAAGLWRVVAARDSSSENAVLGPMRLLLVIVLVIVVAGVAAAAWLLARLSLRPVARLQATAGRLSTGEGEELLPVGDTDDEIARLARTLNILIARLRAATDRERQLVSDASHELRTPIAVIRTQLELARTGDGDVDALRRDIAGAERGVMRLQRLLGSLLELSSIESGEHLAVSSVDAAEDEVRDAVGRSSFRAGGTRLGLRVERAPAVTASGTVPIAAEDLGRIVDNLVSNSLAALGERPGSVQVALSVDAERMLLEVADDGGGLDEDVAGTATHRFTRGRSAVRGAGAGLGLAIVAALVDGAGGSLELHNQPGMGLVVRIRIPVLR